MEKIRNFQDLIVWQKAHSLVLNIYETTKIYPKEEKFGMISQMRRAAVSVPANISEGFKKRSIRDKINFYNIAQGSLSELCYYVIFSKDLKYIKVTIEIDKAIDELSRMLNSLISSLVNNAASAQSCGLR